jgi:hypothetical protein
MWGLRRDQVDFHDENNCLLHKNVSSVAILYVGPQTHEQVEILDENNWLLHSNVSSVVNIGCGASDVINPLDFPLSNSAEMPSIAACK